MRNTDRAVAVHFEEAALFGPIREGTPAGKKEKNRFDGNRKLEGAAAAFLA
jgi:hypothetical protein